MSRSSLCVMWAMLMLVAAQAAAQTATDQWQFGTAPSFSSGKYGTDTRTDVLYTPFTARRLFDDGDLTLVFPLTCIRGNGAVTVVNGSPVRQEPSRTSGSAGSSTPTRGGTSTGGSRPSDSSSTTSTTPATRSNVCGMGDIVVRGRYYFLDERAWFPTIALRAHVKTPTASAERGLGTGRPDEGIGVEITRTLPGAVLVMADGGYTVIGQPAGVDYANNWWYDLGIGQDLAKGTVNLSVFFEEHRAIVPGLENARDILAAVTVKGGSGWRVQLSGQLGLSDGAPDHGVTLGASRRF